MPSDFAAATVCSEAGEISPIDAAAIIPTTSAAKVQNSRTHALAPDAECHTGAERERRHDEVQRIGGQRLVGDVQRLADADDAELHSTMNTVKPVSTGCSTTRIEAKQNDSTISTSPANAVMPNTSGNPPVSAASTQGAR